MANHFYVGSARKGVHCSSGGGGGGRVAGRLQPTKKLTSGGSATTLVCGRSLVYEQMLNSQPLWARVYPFLVISVLFFLSSRFRESARKHDSRTFLLRIVFAV